MADVKGRVKVIIFDKAPSADGLAMQTDLGFNPNTYQPLVDAFNLEFGTNVTAQDVESLQTVNDVIVYMESVIPPHTQS